MFLFIVHHKKKEHNMKTVIRGVWNAKSVLFIAACLFVIHLYFLFPKNPTPVYAQDFSMDIFVRIDGITGPSMDKVHRGWIEATGVKFSMTGAERGTIGGASAHPAILDGVTIVKYIDISSPLLALYCAQGKVIRTVTVHFVESSASDRRVFYEILMSDVMVGGVGVDTNSSEISLKEGYTFLPKRVKWTVTPRNPDGSLGTRVIGCWDFGTNTRCY